MCQLRRLHCRGFKLASLERIAPESVIAPLLIRSPQTSAWWQRAALDSSCGGFTSDGFWLNS